MKKKYFTPEMEEMFVDYPVILLAEGCDGDSETDPVPGCPGHYCDDF